MGYQQTPVGPERRHGAHIVGAHRWPRRTDNEHDQRASVVFEREECVLGEFSSERRCCHGTYALLCETDAPSRSRPRAVLQVAIFGPDCARLKDVPVEYANYAAFGQIILVAGTDGEMKVRLDRRMPAVPPGLRALTRFTLVPFVRFMRTEVDLFGYETLRFIAILHA